MREISGKEVVVRKIRKREDSFIVFVYFRFFIFYLGLEVFVFMGIKIGYKCREVIG